MSVDAARRAYLDMAGVARGHAHEPRSFECPATRDHWLDVDAASITLDHANAEAAARKSVAW